MFHRSPVADHRANGTIENLCRELKRQVRVLRSSLEEKLGRILKDDDPVLSWFPRHAADLMCRYKRGSDGKTRNKGGVAENGESRQSP